MTKSKTKQGMYGMCANCKHVDYDEYNNLADPNDLSKLLCKLTKKIHKYDYSCKKWEKMI